LRDTVKIFAQERLFLRTRPALDLSFSGNRIGDLFEEFAEYEDYGAPLFGKAGK
jgi:hypothetical protein